MFKIWMTNFNYYSQREFTNLEDARVYAKSTSFEVRVDHGDVPVASYSPISGWRNF
jgi:hypothetical protein